MRRGEQIHVAGCAYRVLCCVAQVLFALNGRYLINERGVVGEAAALPITIAALSDAQVGIWRDVGTDDLAGALRRLRGVVDALDALLL